MVRGKLFRILGRGMRREIDTDHKTTAELDVHRKMERRINMEERAKVALEEIKAAFKKALNGCTEMESIAVIAVVTAGVQKAFEEAVNECEFK